MDGHCHERFTTLMVDMLAKQHTMTMKEPEWLFMSDAARSNRYDDLFVIREPSLGNLKFPLNFERFTGAKTVANVTMWMIERATEVNLWKVDFGCLHRRGLK